MEALNNLTRQLEEKAEFWSSLNPNISTAPVGWPPSLGHLNLKAAIKFLEIHTAHPLAIIQDILTPLNDC